MSTISYTKSRPASSNGLYTIATWAALGTSDDGTPIELAQYADRTVQVSGTFDGATVVIEGSLDGEEYKTLTDPQGNALSFTSGGLEAITEVVTYLRPRVSGGTSPALLVTLLMKG